MKKNISALVATFSLFSIASAEITVSQVPIGHYPYYDGCALIYQYGADYSKCNNQAIYQEAFANGFCYLVGSCR